MFDAVGKNYDITNTVLSFGQDARWRRLTRERLNLKPGEKVTVNYGTMVAPLQYSEISCGKDGTYSRVKNQPLASAPVGFWAEAVITASDGSTRKVDVTPDNYRKLPVPTQSDF